MKKYNPTSIEKKNAFMTEEFPNQEHQDLRLSIERTLQELKRFFGVENLSTIELVELRNILKEVQQQVKKEGEQEDREREINKKSMDEEEFWKWKMDRSENHILKSEYEAAARWVCQILGGGITLAELRSRGGGMINDAIKEDIRRIRDEMHNFHEQKDEKL